MDIQQIPQHLIDLEVKAKTLWAESSTARNKYVDKIKELYPKYEGRSFYDPEDAAAVNELKQLWNQKFKETRAAFAVFMDEAKRIFPDAECN